MNLSHIDIDSAIVSFHQFGQFHAWHTYITAYRKINENHQPELTATIETDSDWLMWTSVMIIKHGIWHKNRWVCILTYCDSISKYQLMRHLFHCAKNMSNMGLPVPISCLSLALFSNQDWMQENETIKQPVCWTMCYILMAVTYDIWHMRYSNNY